MAKNKIKNLTAIVTVKMNGSASYKDAANTLKAAVQHLIDNGLLTGVDDELNEVHVDVKPFDGKCNNSPSMALMQFVNTIENTGGLENDGVSPVGDPEWIDLGDAYVKACAALDRKPMIEGGD